MKVAVVDLGTNSAHMLLAEILPNDTFEVIGREKEMIRLGDGTLSSGYLSDELMDRGLETLKKFKFLAQSKGVYKIHAVATSAVREAVNGGDFLKRIQKETGIKVRVITGEEEGRLIYLGVKHATPLPSDHSIILDIGGGSVELMVVTPEEILFLQSLKIGVARLKDHFFQKFTRKEFAKLEEHVEDQIRDAVQTIRRLGFSEAIGTSGTLGNLAAMAFYAHQPGATSVPRSPSFTFEELKKLYEQLKNSSPEDRLERKGLDPLRSDLILSGAALAYVLMKELEIEKITHCDHALREGMIYRYIQKNRRKIKSEAEIPDVRRRNVLKLAHMCDYDRAHAHQVAKLALQIFDRTQVFHQLSSLDRELLEYSALLHDIGYHIGYEKHHRHAYYLIKNVTMNGFTEEEIDLIALVARYHRRAVPKKKHPWYGALPKQARRRVKWLAAILKVADALDRSHFSVVESVKPRIYSRNIIFQVAASDDCEYEIWEATHKCGLLKGLVKQPIVFKMKQAASFKKTKTSSKESRVSRFRKGLRAVK